ncbi:hypothetical protein Tco_0220629, partial [Tanacetum coccineum]
MIGGNGRWRNPAMAIACNSDGVESMLVLLA